MMVSSEPLDIVRMPVVGLGRLVQAGCVFRFDDDTDRGILPEQAVVEANHRSGQGADARLYKNMGRLDDALCGELLLDFGKHRCVALHDPLRNGGVAVPGRIGDDFPAVLFGVDDDLAYRVVVVAVDDLDRGAEVSDCVNARLRCFGVHVDDALVAELAGRPGDAFAVVAVGGRGEGDFAELVFDFGRG